MTEESLKNSKRIAKNTMLLYFRMLLTMLVSLYSVRVVLDTLGIVDYGIYNVVGGIVIAFSFFSSTMASASQRFFAFEIGRGDFVQLKKTFSMMLIIYCLIAVIIVLLAETLGLWFLNYKMVIPSNRMNAVNWVFQFSIFSFVLTMFQVPYDAIVIARERMKVYAYLSILEVTLKLIVVYLLVIFPFDKLTTYAILMFVVTLIITWMYRIYCLRNFQESRFKYYWNKKLFREIIMYSGWSLFGAFASIFNNQGINIILNLFFGPAVNAARGIAYQISTTINGFVQNFMIAARPQITKYYAQRQYDEMLNLVFQSSKYSFFLLYLISLPFLLRTNFIFKIWLTTVPDYVVSFSQIIIITSLIESLSYPLMAAAQATGQIKNYQIIIGGCLLLNLPIAYVLVKIGYAPEATLIVILVNSVICLFLRLIILKKMIGLVIKSFLLNVILPVLSVSILAFIFPYYINSKLTQTDFFGFLLISFSAVVSTLFCIYSIGLKNSERDSVNKWIVKLLIKR